MKILEFLEGTGKDSQGRTLGEILNFSDEQLETTHNYIQWLFPLVEMSDQVLGSPYLDNEDEISAIEESDIAQENLVKALVRMENFYRDNDFWLQPNDHNHLRITRIIKSIKLLNVSDNAEEFYQFILDRVNNYKPVTEESLRYWSEAIA